MKLLLQIFKKYLFEAILILAGIVCLLWNKNPLVADIIKEHNLVEQKSKLVSISYYYPNFSYFAGIVSGTEQPTLKKMETYYEGKPYIFHTYYQKVVEMFPDNDAGYFLYGFCEYYRGTPDLARADFEKSVGLNPYFFWSYYNLGIIYFQQGDFLKSAVILNKALSVPKEYTLEILNQGPFYRQIWRYMTDQPRILGSNLDEGEKDATFLLEDIFVKAGWFDKALQLTSTIGQGNTWHQELQKTLNDNISRKKRATDDSDRLIRQQIPVRLF